MSVYERIEELYNSYMWVTDIQREWLKEKALQEGMTEDQLLDILASADGTAKRNFSKVFARMGDKREYYKIPKLIFEVGKSSTITISCKYRFQKIVGEYRVFVSPFYNYSNSASSYFSPFEVTVRANDNRIEIPYTFDHEDMYIVNVFYRMDTEELFLLSATVYALESDLFVNNFYKADLHIHTTYSDGYEPVEMVITSARAAGMDIVAITDHNAFMGSVAAREKAEELQMNLTVILGEEYSLEYSPMHILSLGTEKPIARKYLSKQVLEMAETQKIIDQASELTCDVEAYACTQVLLDEVTRMGGISILAHPYWKPISRNGTRMDTPESLFIELGKDRRFAGIELVSGSQDGECNVSNLQMSLAREILGTCNNIPVIGITDSHYYTSDPICGKHFTVIISRSEKKMM